MVTAALVVVLVVDEVDAGEVLQLVIPQRDRENTINKTKIPVDF